MKEKMLLMLVGMMLDKLDPEDVKKWADMGLDMIEDKVAGTETEIDNKVVLPLVNVVRDTFGIEDGDE